MWLNTVPIMKCSCLRFKSNTRFHSSVENKTWTQGFVTEILTDRWGQWSLNSLSSRNVSLNGIILSSPDINPGFVRTQSFHLALKNVFCTAVRIWTHAPPHQPGQLFSTPISKKGTISRASWGASGMKVYKMWKLNVQHIALFHKY